MASTTCNALFSSALWSWATTHTDNPAVATAKAEMRKHYNHYSRFLGISPWIRSETAPCAITGRICSLNLVRKVGSTECFSALCAAVLNAYSVVLDGLQRFSAVFSDRKPRYSDTTNSARTSKPSAVFTCRDTVLSSGTSTAIARP